LISVDTIIKLLFLLNQRWV